MQFMPGRAVYAYEIAACREFLQSELANLAGQSIRNRYQSLRSVLSSLPTNRRNGNTLADWPTFHVDYHTANYCLWSQTEIDSLQLCGCVHFQHRAFQRGISSIFRRNESISRCRNHIVARLQTLKIILSAVIGLCGPGISSDVAPGKELNQCAIDWCALVRSGYTPCNLNLWRHLSLDARN